ncbi:MAG: CBS domain-containing protein [Saprospiraceae bacterium]|nr:CBS domain-containing protein [Saprospiraceae bacterium]
MLLDTPIGKLMTEDVIVIEAHDQLRDIVSTFNNHGIRHAPVVQNGRLVGMLSWIDLKKLPVSDADGIMTNNGKIVASELMSREPVSVQTDDTLEELAEIFTENEFHAVPVLEGSRIVGIVSTTDVIKYFLYNAQ